MRLSDRQIADRGYDQDKYRRLVWKRGIKPIIASRRTEHRSGLGRHRWIVERTFAWLHNRPASASAPTAATTSTKASFALACRLVCRRRLENSIFES